MKFTMYAGYSSMLKREGAAATADYAVKMGFSSVEVLESTGEGYPYSVPDVASAKEIKKVLDDHGLVTACYSVGTTIYKNPDAVESLMRQAEIAAALGCPYLHHTLITGYRVTPDLPAFDEVMADIVPSAVRIAEYAKTLGVRCLYEDQGLYANGLEGFGAFYSQVKEGTDNVGVCGDMGNCLFVDCEPEKFFAAFATEIYHVHVKDYLRKSVPESPGIYWLPTRGGNWLRGTTIGSGIVDYDACMHILKTAGYAGHYALELEHPEPFEDGVRQGIQYLGRWA